MKMKEVCTASGLTERAVRFYVQEGLAAPDAQRRGGRTWLDFSPADVERLKAIATLRRAGFTVEELRAMTKDFPQAAPEAAFALRRRLRERLEAYERVCQSDPALAEGLEDYAAQLWGDVAREPLPAADRARSPLPWERWVEWGSMALTAWLGFRLYEPPGGAAVLPGDEPCEHPALSHAVSGGCSSHLPGAGQPVREMAGQPPGLLVSQTGAPGRAAPPANGPARRYHRD